MLFRYDMVSGHPLAQIFLRNLGVYDIENYVLDLPPGGSAGHVGQRRV